MNGNQPHEGAGRPAPTEHLQTGEAAASAPIAPTPKTPQAEGYLGEIKSIGSAFAGLFRRAADDVGPALGKAKTFLYDTVGQTKSSLEKTASGMFSMPHDPWVENIPASERGPRTLLQHPHLIVRTEDGAGDPWNNDAMDIFFVLENDDKKGGYVHGAILRLMTAIDSQGATATTTPVLTIERVTTPMIGGSWEAALATNALSSRWVLDDIQIRAYFADPEALAQAAPPPQNPDEAKNAAFARLKRGPQELPQIAETGWEAFRGAIARTNATARPLSELGPNFSVDTLFVHAVKLIETDSI